MANTHGSSGTLKRAKMAAALLGCNLTAIAKNCGCTLPHLRGVLLGERRPSERLAEAMREAFGSSWRFVRGEVDIIEVAQ